MVPWKEPDVRPVFRSVKRSTMKLPWAPVNRPVPPVMVWISTIWKTPGVSVGSLRPKVVVKTVSPLAAMKLTGPDPVPSARFTTKFHVNVN